MTFNLPRWSRDPDPEKAQALLAYVRSVRPELITLQEANTVYSPRSPRGRPSPHVDVLFDSLGYRIAPLEGLDGRLTVQDPILAHLPLGEQEIIELPNPANDPHSAQLVRVPFRWGGREAVLYNVHLRSFGHEKLWDERRHRLLDPRLWRRYAQRYREAYLLRAVEAEAIVDILEEETRPYLLCGDFNSTPHNWTYRHIVRELGLQDVFEEVGQGLGGTYHARHPFARIDFVLASPAWEPVAARVDDVRLSDHRPLLVRLRWKDE